MWFSRPGTWSRERESWYSFHRPLSICSHPLVLTGLFWHLVIYSPHYDHPRGFLVTSVCSVLSISRKDLGFIKHIPHIQGWQNSHAAIYLPNTRHLFLWWWFKLWAFLLGWAHQELGKALFSLLHSGFISNFPIPASLPFLCGVLPGFSQVMKWSLQNQIKFIATGGTKGPHSNSKFFSGAVGRCH